MSDKGGVVPPADPFRNRSVRSVRLVADRGVMNRNFFPGGQTHKGGVEREYILSSGGGSLRKDNHPSPCIESGSDLPVYTKQVSGFIPVHKDHPHRSHHRPQNRPLRYIMARHEDPAGGAEKK